jgi:predicted transcriptional regulator
MNLEDVFSSKLRMTILKIVVRMGEVNVSEIARRIGANYGTTNEHLKILENEGVLQHKVFGRIRLYRLDEHSPKAKAVQNLIETWEHANKQ